MASVSLGSQYLVDVRGIVLNPVTLFMYANELWNIVESQVLLHADDVKIWREITGDVDAYAVQEDLDATVL